MAEYIEREAATAAVCHAWAKGLEPTQYIEVSPAADVAPVVRGRWEHGYNNGRYGIWCSNCKTGFVYSEQYEICAATHKYCPGCGAKMQQEDCDNE